MKAACALALSLALAAPPPALWASFQAASPRGGLPQVPPTAAPGADGWRAHLARPGVFEGWGTFLSERFGADLGAPEAVAAAPAVLAELVRPARPEEAATPEALQAAIEREAARHAVELVAAARAGGPAARARLEAAAPLLALFPEAARRELAEAYLQLLGPELRLGPLAARLLRERETGSGVFASAPGTPPPGLAPAPEPGQVRAPRDPAASPRAVPAVRAPEPRGRWLKALLLAALLSLPGHDVRPHAPPPPAVPAAAQWKAWSDDGQHVAVRWRGPDGRLREDVGLVVYMSGSGSVSIVREESMRVPISAVVSAEEAPGWRSLPRMIPSALWLALVGSGLLAAWIGEKLAAFYRLGRRALFPAPRPGSAVSGARASLLLLQEVALTAPGTAALGAALLAVLFPPTGLGLAAAALIMPALITLMARLGFGALLLFGYLAYQSPELDREGGLSERELAARRPADLARLVSEHRVLLLGEFHNETGHLRLTLDSLVAMRRAGLTHVVEEQGSGRGWHLFSALTRPHHLQLLLLASLLGIKVVGIDDGPWLGSENDSERNQIMAERIAAILAEDPRARVFYSVGDAHLTQSPTVTGLLEDKGVKAHPILVVNALPPDAVAHSWIAQDIRAAELQDEAFYIDKPNGYSHRGILHAPDSAGLWWLPRPWAALKRWAGAARYRLGRLIS